jgi:hypothetical protein
MATSIALTEQETQRLPDMYFQLLFRGAAQETPKRTYSADEQRQRKVLKSLNLPMPDEDGRGEQEGNGEPEAHTTCLVLDITQVSSFHTETFAGVENGEAVRVYMRSGASHLLYCTLGKFSGKRQAALAYLGRKARLLPSMN